VEGEAFLEVIHEDKRSFTVKTNELDVVVTGTQFDVKAYRNDENMYVALVEGSVSVGKKHDEALTVLRPDQIYIFNVQTKEAHSENVDVSEFVAWKDGYYQFHSRNMEIVLQKLIEYYGVKIEWNRELNKLTCSGKLDMKEDLQDVLTALSKAAPITVIKKDKSYYIDLKPLK